VGGFSHSLIARLSLRLLQNPRLSQTSQTSFWPRFSLVLVDSGGCLPACSGIYLRRDWRFNRNARATSPYEYSTHRGDKNQISTTYCGFFEYLDRLLAVEFVVRRVARGIFMLMLNWLTLVRSALQSGSRPSMNRKQTLRGRRQLRHVSNAPALVEVLEDRALLAGNLIQVDTAGDGSPAAGHNTLRTAIAAANLTTGDVITFSSSLANTTITLTQGELLVTKTMTIVGANAPGLVIDGGGNSRILTSPARIRRWWGFRLSHCMAAMAWGRTAAGAAARSTTPGRSTWKTSRSTGTVPRGPAAAIYSATGSTLKLKADTFTGNSAGTSGGGVYDLGNMTLTTIQSQPTPPSLRGRCRACLTRHVCVHVHDYHRQHGGLE